MRKGRIFLWVMLICVVLGGAFFLFVKQLESDDEDVKLKEFRVEEVRENEGKSVVDVMREVYRG